VLDAGGDPDYVAPDGTTSVQLAMYQHDYGFAARMIERGASLDAVDRNGFRLLHAAVLADQPQLVTLLLARGADPNALTGVSRVKWRFEQNFKPGDYEAPPESALLLAAEHGYTDVMALLADADSRFRDRDGSNIVLAAATSGVPQALELALRLQPDANTTTSDGQTPLHLLLASGSGAEGAGPQCVAMMRLLFEHGARIDIKNHDGQTAADIGEDDQFSGKSAFETIFRPQPARRL
jgi:ankyrin repeat protein